MNGVATLTLNRPDKRNAMNPRMHEEITDALDELRYNDEATVVVITGAGKSFCAGMDLKEFFHELKIEKPREFDRIFRLATEWRGRTLRQYPKPTIAMVNGYCFGGAFSIVEGCDWPLPQTKRHSACPRSISAPSRAVPSPSHSRTSCIRAMRCIYAMTGRYVRRKKAAEIKFVNYVGASRRAQIRNDEAGGKDDVQGSSRFARVQGWLSPCA